METHVILVHGIRVIDKGQKSIGQLAEHFINAGHTVEMLDYGRFGLFAPRWQNNGVAKKLADQVNSLADQGVPVIVVGHSNGCAITHMAGENHGARIHQAVYIAPALNSNIKFPASFNSFLVFHNPKDWVVKLSAMLFAHYWGDMGAVGFTRFDHRGRNSNVLTNFEQSSGSSHSYFDSFFAPLIVREILNIRGTTCTN